MKERRRKKTRLVFRQISLTMLAIGGVMLLNDQASGKWAFSAGGFLFALYLFMKAFEPIREEPNWELVYPELGLGLSEEDLDAYYNFKKEKI